MVKCKDCKHMFKKNKEHPRCLKSVIIKYSHVDGEHVKYEKCVHANPNGNCPAFERSALARFKEWFK